MSEKFSYLLSNLELANINSIDTILSILIGIFVVAGLRFLFLYSYGYLLVLRDEADIRRKKETLSELILMKDIQTELEKEVEKAMLKATFQG